MEAAYCESLPRLLEGKLHFYAEPRRLDISHVLKHAPGNAVFYVCGPAAMIDAARQEAQDLSLGFERLRYERFEVAAPSTPSKPIHLVLRRSGEVIDVAADQTILEALEAARIDAPYSCRTGICGTCAVKVLGGTPEHRDEVLSEAERRQAGLMCICVSRAESAELVLDL